MANKPDIYDENDALRHAGAPPLKSKSIWACPWCGSGRPPGLTRHHADVAEFVWSQKNEESIRRNPRICLDCHGVGGSEDFMAD